MGRGVRKKCPRCGGGHLYDGWFRMKDRCPTCGVRFEREEGFFVGAYLINLAIVIVLLFVLCMVFVVMKDRDPDVSIVGPLVIGCLIAVAAPVLSYPFARTIWSAIDLGMTPLEPFEEAEIATYLSARDGAPVDDDGPSPDDLGPTAEDPTPPEG